jgi:hypothetical protein
VGARKLRVSNLTHELFNVNTPGDKTKAERLRRRKIRTGRAVLLQSCERSRPASDS